MTSAFAQHKLVQKPSKEHRFDCLASKLHSSRVAHLNWPVTIVFYVHKHAGAVYWPIVSHKTNCSMVIVNYSG